MLRILHTLWPAFSGAVSGPLAAIISSAVQRKAVGGVRAWKAVVAGLIALATWFGLRLGLGETPSGWADYALTTLAYIGVLVFLGWLSDHVVYGIGRLGQRLSETRLRKLRHVSYEHDGS